MGKKVRKGEVVSTVTNIASVDFECARWIAEHLVLLLLGLFSVFFRKIAEPTVEERPVYHFNTENRSSQQLIGLGDLFTGQDNFVG